MLNLWDTKDFEFAIAEELARSYVSSADNIIRLNPNM